MYISSSSSSSSSVWMHPLIYAVDVPLGVLGWGDPRGIPPKGYPLLRGVPLLGGTPQLVRLKKHSPSMTPRRYPIAGCFGTAPKVSHCDCSKRFHFGTLEHIFVRVQHTLPDWHVGTVCPQIMGPQIVGPKTISLQGWVGAAHAPESVA